MLMMRKNFEEPTCDDCKNQFETIFKKLNEEQLVYLFENKICSIKKKGSILYEEGNRITGIYCISDGICKVYKTGIEGKEQIIKFARKGDVIGYRSALNNEPACTSVQVIEDATLCHITTAELYFLLKKNSEFAIEMLQIACTELGEANTYLTEIAQKTGRERLAETLLELEKDFGVTSEGTINISLSREDLANIIGTATESVIRILSEFKNNGLIHVHGRRIKILKADGLRKYSSIF